MTQTKEEEEKRAQALTTLTTQTKEDVEKKAQAQMTLMTLIIKMKMLINKPLKV